MTRRWLRAILVIGAAALSGTLLAADAPLVTGTMPANLLVGGSERVMILSPQGAAVWEHKCGLVHDAWMLPNGNVLYADGAVAEVTPDKKIVFQYKSQVGQGGGAFACQRLENGNTLVGENSTGRVLEVDPQGKIVFKLEIPGMQQGSHDNMRMARKLKNGNYLVCLKGGHLVREYTPKGEVVLELKTANIAFAAVRTPQNTTLVSSLDHVTEFDAAGKKVWDLANTDLPGTKITNMTGIELLPGGDLVIGCYAAYDKGEGTGLFQVTREKKVVWSYANPKADGSLMAVQSLDKDQKPVAGEIR